MIKVKSLKNEGCRVEVKGNGKTILKEVMYLIDGLIKQGFPKDDLKNAIDYTFNLKED